MIIDDQQSTRKLLKHFLGHSYNVIEETNCKSALATLATGTHADAIVSDILMPEMTGIDFLRAIQKTSASAPPVIMLSGVENSSEKLKCFQFGAKDYITKPFNPVELRVRLKNVLTQ